MKVFYIILLLLTCILPAARCQDRKADSLEKLLLQTPQDTTRVLLLVQLTLRNTFFKSDTALILARQAIALAQKLGFSKGEIRALIRLGEARRLRGEYPQALEEQLMALQLSRQTHNSEEEANAFKFIGLIYIDLGEYRHGLNYLFQSMEISKRIHQQFSAVGLSNIGNAYEKMGKLDSALYYQQQALASRAGELGGAPDEFLRANILTRLGIIQNRLGKTNTALQYYQQALQTTYTSGDVFNRARPQYEIAELYDNTNNLDSSFHYAQLSFENAQKSANKMTLLNASTLLAKLYKAKGRIDSAFNYQNIAIAANDSLFGAEKFRQLQLLTLNEQQRVHQLHEEQERARTQTQRTVLLSALGLFLLITLILWHNNRQKQKANALLQQQKQQTEQQKVKAEHALENLKATQAQLVQQQKMVSLGELTAGIAHEIQNPLNFVNNFSDVNKELLAELKDEADKGNIDEVKAIANDVIDNEEKINHHGKRADAIVKGMLQHSRTSGGQKEPTDINKLANEYLRLSYHGLRAKDKTFNADFKTDFDETIGKIDIVPQDIGRVLLNLYNNAFYAVHEHLKKLGGDYKPRVTVSTKKLSDKIEIIVKDNGMGISKSLVDKIFQPFFTTKPTGEGSGLGLSLSYDIIKAHGGEIKVETTEGQGSIFIIHLPTN